MATADVRIEIGDYTFTILGKDYDGKSVLGDASKKDTVFGTKEEADEALVRIRTLIEDLGNWEQTISMLRNVREGVKTEKYSEPQPIRLADLELLVPDRPRMSLREEPFRIILDLSGEARSATGHAERPWLWKASTWVAAFENLKRWKSLRAVLADLR